jgi:two-component system, NtrC family, sensor kinase
VEKAGASGAASRLDLRFFHIAFAAAASIGTAGELALAAAYGRGLAEAALGFLLMAAVSAAVFAAFWAYSRRLMGPLRAVVAAIEAFSRGAPAEEAEGALPSGGPSEIAYVAAQIGDYMRRTRGTRSELEAMVASRTLELELRNALLRSISSSDDDDRAYSAVAEAIRAPVRADAALVAFYDELTILKAAARIDGAASVWSLQSSEEEVLRRAASGEGVPLPGLESVLGFSAAYRLESQGEDCGYIAFARRRSPFAPEERAILARSFASFSVQALMRKRRTREGYIRGEAERALRKSEERLRTFFAESSDMIYTANADDIIASINDAGLALLGLKDRFEALGRPFSNHVLSPEDRQNFLSRMRERGLVVDFECVFKRKDGTAVFCLESARAVKDADGDIVEIQGIVKDISERIASERELWKANLELAEANEKLQSTRILAIQQEKLASIGQLAAGVAHEINNPLGFLSSNHNTIQGFLKSMRGAWEEAAAADPARMDSIARAHDLEYVLGELDSVLSESDEGFRRIIDIVQSLKSFARIDTAQVMSAYNLNEGIKSTLAVARNEVKYVAEVELELADIPPVIALGGEINQVLLNLLVNAAQAIASQKRDEMGKIVVSTYKKSDRVCVAIADDGPGVPEQIRLKVFDPFFTTKEPGKGTGLGLALSYDIVTRKHGGSLVLEDSPLGGALFRIELPIEAARVGEAENNS